MALKFTRPIKRIILHCTGSSLPKQSVEALRSWHQQHNHWTDIGYHYVIAFSGQIEEGRPLNDAGAHTQGHNHDSIGIALAGNSLKDFTNQQENALYLLLRLLKPTFPTATIHGHSEFNPNKTCPIFDIAPFKRFYEVSL